MFPASILVHVLGHAGFLRNGQQVKVSAPPLGRLDGCERRMRFIKGPKEVDPGATQPAYSPPFSHQRHVAKEAGFN